MLEDVFGACRNCGATDYDVDAERGESTCHECGCVNTDAPLLVASARYKDMYDCSGNRHWQAPLVESVRAGIYSESVDDVHAQQRQQAGSAPYQRSTYFAERLSQWRGEEPSIPTDDFNEIKQLYYNYTDRWGLHPERQRWERGYCLSKEDTRQLLWEIDRDRMKREHRPYFVKKYLVSHSFMMRCCLMSARSPGDCCMHGGLCVHATL